MTCDRDLQQAVEVISELKAECKSVEERLVEKADYAAKMQETTDKLKTESMRLQAENARLVAETDKLKSKLLLPPPGGEKDSRI